MSLLTRRKGDEQGKKDSDHKRRPTVLPDGRERGASDHFLPHFTWWLRFALSWLAIENFDDKGKDNADPGTDSSKALPIPIAETGRVGEASSDHMHLI